MRTCWQLYARRLAASKEGGCMSSGRKCANVERIKAIMADNEMNQTRFAAAIGMSQANLSLILSGRRKLSVEYLRAISERFGVRPEELW